VSLGFAGRLHGQASSGGFHQPGVGRLVGKHWHDDQRQAGREGSEGRAGAAVADHRGSRGEHVSLRHPCLDVHVGGDIADGLDISRAPDSEQDTDGQAADGVERRPEGLVPDRRAARHRAEGHVDQRRVASLPPVRERRA
jgi:hypothetical protein